VVTTARWQFTISGVAMMTVFVALVLWSWSIPEVFAALGSRSIGKEFAVLRFALFWAGLAIVAWRGRTASRRFVGFGWVFLAVLACPVLMPQIDVAMIPDFPAYGQFVLLVGASALFVAGGVAQFIATRWARKEHPGEPTPPGP
jgi:hypothetical protein